MSNSGKIGRRQFSWARRLLFSLIPVGLLLLVTEGALMLVGVRPVTDLRDPYVGFASQVPLFEESQASATAGMMTTAYSKLVWFNPQTFPRLKPEGTRRLFCLGGSTTFGHPYADPTSYVGWMRELLPVVDSSRHWEVINVGGVSYASYRVAALMQELVQYQPDVFVVYTAQNEFLERRTYAGMFEQSSWLVNLQARVARTRTFALMDYWLLGTVRDGARDQEQGRGDQAPPADILPAEVDELLNHTIGPVDYQRDTLWREQVVEHYRLNLQRMVDIATAAGAQIVFVTPASNEKDCSPFKSQVDEALSDSQRAELAGLMQRAQAASATDDYAGAIGLYEQALKIDSGVADAHYQLGTALFANQDFAKAHQAFQRAIEEDVCPLRAIAALTGHVRSVSQRNGVPVVDFEQRLTQQCQQVWGHACLGREFFLDHVHPDINTHRQLAVWIIDSLQQAGWVGGRSLQLPEYAAAVQTVVSRVESEIDQRQHGIALRNLSKVFHWSGKFAEAAPRASDALELLPGDPESRFVLADCLKNTGDPAGALAQYEILIEDAPNYLRALIPFGELLVEQGMYERAKPQLLVALLQKPDNAYALYLLGVAHLNLKEYEFAVECLQRADQLYPGDPQTQLFLNQARAGGQ
jgi:tetratricopeptide (TPR) repeat protein